MITTPMPFQEAIAFLLGKEQLPAEWDVAMWAEQESDFQTKAFFSAKVENARFLDRAQGLIFDCMGNRLPEIEVEKARQEKTQAEEEGWLLKLF